MYNGYYWRNFWLRSDVDLRTVSFPLQFKLLLQVFFLFSCNFSGNKYFVCKKSLSMRLSFYTWGKRGEGGSYLENIGDKAFVFLKLNSRCMLSTVQHRHVAIARLSHPTNLGRTMQDLRFIIIVIAPSRAVGFQISSLFNILVKSFFSINSTIDAVKL